MGCLQIIQIMICFWVIGVVRFDSKRPMIGRSLYPDARCYKASG